MIVRMKRKKKSHILFVLVIFAGLMVLSIYAPDKLKQYIGYQFYIVYTDSMEPTIPTNSLVLVKLFKENENLSLEPQQIITFHARRFEENIIITHHFNKIEMLEDGLKVYRTNAEGANNLDAYDTTREDLIGSYVLHVPYLGKIVLFLKRQYGILLLAEFFIIYLINQLITARWEEKEIREKLDASSRIFRQNVFVCKIDYKYECDKVVLNACVINALSTKVKYILVEFTFFNQKDELIYKDQRYIIGKEGLESGDKKDFIYNLYGEYAYVRCNLNVVRFKT